MESVAHVWSGEMQLKIMLDCSPKKISDYDARYGEDFWQLRTPLTGYNLSGKPFGLDNGCFAEFKEKKWLSLLVEARETPPIFCCMPDVVGDAFRTLELFDIFKHKAKGLPLALVLQDGIGSCRIPWDEISAVFIGGTDKFKCSPEAFAAARAARMLGKWVHVGRVNTASRLRGWVDYGDSLDGSGISKFDANLVDVLGAIKSNQTQEKLF